MAHNSPRQNSIFHEGRIKPGTYKIQNIVSKTYVDIKDHVRELCGRPFTALESGRGEWEINPLGLGYTIQKARTSAAVQPEQYCTMLDGIGNGFVISVSDLPVAWRIQRAEDSKYSGFEYVRILWGSTTKVWDLAQYGSDRDGTKVQLIDNVKPEACRIWELIPVRVRNPESAHASSSSTQRDTSVPPYEENGDEHCCRCSHFTTEPGDDGIGTTVVEVTTITTRKKYRLED